MGKILYKIKEAKPLKDDYQIKEIRIDNDNIAWGVDTISITDLKAKIKNAENEIKRYTDKKTTLTRQVSEITKMLDAKLTDSEEIVDDSEIPVTPSIEIEESKSKKEAS